jgi:hypothetical protein
MNRRSIESYKPGVAGGAGFVYRKQVRVTGYLSGLQPGIFWTGVNVSRVMTA